MGRQVGALIIGALLGGISRYDELRVVVREADLRREARPAPEVLHSHECGNDRLFLQHVSFEVNLVNRNKDHVRLIEADVDAYTCEAC